MDVVDGKIVSAAENKRGFWVGAKRASDSVVTEGSASSFRAAGAGCTNSGEKIPFLVEQMTKITTIPSPPPLPGFSDDSFIDVREWLGQINSRISNESPAGCTLATSSCEPGLSAVRSPGNAQVPSDAPHLRQHPAAAGCAGGAPSPPFLKRQKSGGLSREPGWMPDEPLSPRKAGAAGKTTAALAIVKREPVSSENCTNRMNGIHDEGPCSPLQQKKSMMPGPSPHPRPEQLLASCCKTSEPTVSSASLPADFAAKTLTRCTTSGATAASPGIANEPCMMRYRTTTISTAPAATITTPRTIQPSSVFDAAPCSFVGSSSCMTHVIPGGGSSSDFGCVAAARHRRSSSAAAAMTSCCYGGSAADHAVSQQLPVKRSLLQSQDHLAENSSACRTRSVSMHSDHTGTTRLRHMHSAAAGARAAPLSCSSTGMAWSSPPAESGPIVVDTPLVSWASYSQAANSVFSTKPPAAQSRSWAEPLKILLQKELTLTDVGELGRIILPKNLKKKDAESQLPQLDAKEGQFLQMEDYNSNRRWNLRYKWWPNNKSRMYLLESAGEFIKFYELKEKDMLILYKDAEGKLVIRGQKATPSFLQNDSIGDPTASSCSKNTGRRSIKGVCSRGAASTCSTRIASPSSAMPRQWGRRGCTEPVSALDSEAKKGSLRVKLENSSSSAEGNTSKDTGSPPNSTGSGSSTGEGDFVSPPTSLNPTNATHLDTKPLNCDLMLAPAVQVCPNAFAEVVNDLDVETENASLGYMLQLDTGFDWGKLPDPPALELPSFKFEETWGDSM